MHRSYLGSLWHFHKPTHLNNHTQSKRTEYNQEPGTPSDEHTREERQHFLEMTETRKETRQMATKRQIFQ